MNKKYFFSVLLLVSFNSFLLFTQEPYVHSFVKLTNKLLEAFDGRSPAGFNGDSCLDTLQVRALINKVLRGEPDRATQTFKKPYDLNGIKVALDDLVELEKAGKIIPGTPFEAQFNACLKSIKEEFLNFTGPLLNEADLAREQTLKLVKEWCEKSGRTDSMMLNWGKYDKEQEREILFAASAREFRRFCRDLKNFLHDLAYSCPKGRELFKEQRLSMLALKDTFTQLTGKPGKDFEAAFNALAEQKVRESDNHATEADLKQYIDRRKKHKLSSDGQLLDIIFEALEAADKSVSKEAFEERFYKVYAAKCKQFDASFIDNK